jgi:signal transduction histidine kinase
VFLVVGLLTGATILIGTNVLSDRAASDEALAEAGRTTQLLAQSVIGPEMPPELVHLRPDNLPEYIGVLESFDRQVRERLHDTDRPFLINIWARDGRLIYSSKIEVLLADLAELHLDIDKDQHRILKEGGIGSEIADPNRPEDQAASGTRGMMRIYTRFITASPGKNSTPESRSGANRPVLLEVYFPLEELSKRQTEIFDSFRWITIGGLTLLIVVTTAILLGLTRELRRTAAERERLLVTAMEASDAERRRIARDLHDSVVQDLAGTSFAVTAVARAPGTDPEARATLDDAGSALRSSLKSLRALLAEIHPPDLTAAELPAALADLIAPAGAAGMQASVSVEGAEGASDEQTALLWRVAQEAVRNAIRHSDASTLAVTVRGDDDRLVLEVVDDGIGFDPRGQRAGDSYGLRGLRSLVADRGGELRVRSSPGDGTTVRMEVHTQ